MRILVVLALVLGGCSFVRSGPANSTPAHGCSRGSAYGDFALAAVGVAALATTMIVFDCTPDTHCADRSLNRIGVTSGVGLAVIETIQGGYGLNTAKACEAKRAKLRPILQ